jgi:hypothetical protein
MNIRIFNHGFYGRAAARLLRRNKSLEEQIDKLKIALEYYTDPIFEGQRLVALKAINQLKDATPQRKDAEQE